MFKVVCFYAVFTPVSTLIGNYLAEALYIFISMLMPVFVVHSLKVIYVHHYYGIIGMVHRMDIQHLQLLFICCLVLYACQNICVYYIFHLRHMLMQTFVFFFLLYELFFQLRILQYALSDTFQQYIHYQNKDASKEQDTAYNQIRFPEKAYSKIPYKEHYQKYYWRIKNSGALLESFLLSDI